MADISVSTNETIEITFSITDNGELNDIIKIKTENKEFGDYDFKNVEKFTWTPTDDDVGTHTFEVNGEEISIEVNEIPDALTNQWPANEGSGTTHSDIINSKDGTINGPNWQSLEDAVGGNYLLYDGTRDITSLPDGTFSYIDSSDFTFTAIVRVDNISGQHTMLAYGDIDWVISEGRLRFVKHDTNSYNTDITVTEGDWVFVAVRYNQSTEEMKFTINDQEETANLTITAGASSTAQFGETILRNDRYFEGGMDEITSSDSYLSDNDINSLKKRRSDI